MEKSNHDHVTIKSQARYQLQCIVCECDVWHYGTEHVVCPHCGVKLNEQSSEDADDGCFYDSQDGAAVSLPIPHVESYSPVGEE